jgi:hypothetical protein
MTRTPTSIPELRSYYADKYDCDDLGVIDEADALPGWKCFQCLDGGCARSGAGGVCRPILGGLCTPGTYKTNVDHAKCAGVPAEKHLSVWSPRYNQRVDTTRFAPCRPAPTWGCPARCGLHSNVYMAEARHGMPVAAIALTRSWGQVIRADSGIGDAWRAQHCRIIHLFIAEKFSTIRTSGDAHRGFKRRYRCPVTVVPGGDRAGLIPVPGYLEAADAAALPNRTRPEAP